MGTVRIIAGTLRGRRLQVARGDAVRPTSDRVREALFSTISSRLRGASVLDAYAGTGVLGFEALSRGAESVAFAEISRGGARGLRDAAERFGVSDRCRVVEGAVLELLRGGRLGGPFDVILADPPYDLGQQAELVRRAATERGLAPSGILVLERAARDAPVALDDTGLVLVRSRAYGNTRIDLFERGSGPAG
ncbi:MAG: 16S rRNA (guanine(966)-N(2))-methyltransferase RsmD [bacterium]|nr:16S rRNA (guanine(966)-N(2))-methyltransferase RsmD [bacterium]